VDWRSLRRWAAKETRGFILRESLKYLVLTIAAIILGWLLTITSALFHLQTPLTMDALKNRAVDLATQFLAHPYDLSIGLLQADPVHSISLVCISAIVLVLFVLVRRARRKLREQSSFLLELAKDRALVEQAGLGGRWPHARVGVPGGAPWDAIRAEILEPHNQFLCILGANGIDTFGRQASPLYETLSQFQRTTRVILVSARSKQVDGRASAIGMDVQEYKNAIQISVRKLQELKRQMHPVEGRFYDGQPNWKLIITSRTAWMQYYMPGGMHVDATPAWRFDHVEDASCLYYYFHMEFDRIWRRCENDPMNLN
jgi:hypothetical protein